MMNIINLFLSTALIFGNYSSSIPRTILGQSSMGTALILTEKGKPQKVLWITEMENCHSLVLSPNQKYVAFICELNGLVVMKLD